MKDLNELKEALLKLHRANTCPLSTDPFEGVVKLSDVVEIGDDIILNNQIIELDDEWYLNTVVAFSKFKDIAAKYDETGNRTRLLKIAGENYRRFAIAPHYGLAVAEDIRKKNEEFQNNPRL